MAFGAFTAVADGLKMTPTSKQLSFSRYRSLVQSQTHIVRGKSFRPPFSKGGGSGQSPAFLPDKLQFYGMVYKRRLVDLVVFTKNGGVLTYEGEEC